MIRHNQDGARCMPDNVFCGAAKQNVLEAGRALALRLIGRCAVLMGRT